MTVARAQGPFGSVDTIRLKHPQDKVFVFRPCYVEPPGLPADFYELNNIDCPTESGYHLELGDDEEAPPYPYKFLNEDGTEGKVSDLEVDPACFWSTIYQWELNPPTLYIGYDDPCWTAYPVPEHTQYVNLYFYIEGAWGDPEVAAAGGGGMPGMGSMPGGMPSTPDMGDMPSTPDMGDMPSTPDIPGGMPSAPGGMPGMGGMGMSFGETVEFMYGDPIKIRIEMEKGKRLSPALMPDNVGTQGQAGTGAVVLSGAAGAAFGDPLPMVKNLQETASGGTTNAPLNANMRLFAAKFGWVNMGFLNPPPETLVNALIPSDDSTPRRFRRLQNEAAANGTDCEDCDEEDAPKASDLPDPNESGNGGFLRKSGVSADEFFIGQMMAIVITPSVSAYVSPKFTKRYETVRNTFRNKVLKIQETALKHDQFKDLAPEFDSLLLGMPQYQVPAKYSLSTTLLTLLTVQNMGICQCSLMAIFEGRAITTIMAAFVAMALFPGGFILYTFITLRGVMQPAAKMPIWAGGATYWKFAQTILGSVPLSMNPGDIAWIPSIPPELLVKPKPVKPVVPPGTPPDEAKKIVQDAVALNKKMVKDRVAAIKRLGPEAIMIAGKWKIGGIDPQKKGSVPSPKHKAANQWWAVYGSQMKSYNGMGFALVAVEQVKRLLQIVVLAGLATTPSLGPIQVKILTVIGFIEFAIICYTRPFVKLAVNFNTMGTHGMKVSQMIAPILLGLGMVEDQFTALFMMASNAATSLAGVLKEWQREQLFGCHLLTLLLLHALLDS